MSGEAGQGGAITPLALHGVGKRFGRLAVLRAVDLEVVAGEIVGLVGANGSGKTTLLSIVAGLLPQSEGERCFGGRPSPTVEMEHRRRLAFVTHTTQLYGGLTARENLKLFAELRCAADAPWIDGGPLLERLGLSHAADRMVGTFSRGMMQRLALARALAGRPELLLLDEPFTSLDRPGRRLLAEVLAEERARGLAVLLSSHDTDAIIEVTDRVVLLEGGRLIDAAALESDDPERLRYRAAVQGLGLFSARSPGPSASSTAAVSA
ncbi:MAG: heme ABC exporter ATP-binding protein CcmA [Nannocystaceae bacterium]|nr:heme ABC exporter ATP-binding protein CcmA [Nannocystaceae bacterium]